MQDSIRAIGAALSLCVLAGCASVPQKQVSQQTLAGIKTIVVIRPPEPTAYLVNYLSSPATMFGAVGGLVAGLDIQKKSDALTAAFQAQNTRFCPPVADKIAANLTAMGYQVRVEDDAWEKSDKGYKLNPDKLKRDADATLLLTPGMTGFVARSTFHDYAPTMIIMARLVGRDGKEDLYLTKNVAGWDPTYGDWRRLPVKTRIANFDAIMADIPAAAQSIMEAGDAIVVAVTEDFKR
jgi:hypothetical protein